MRRGLYAIVDLDALEVAGHAPLAFAEQLVARHPAALQLRAKHAGARRTLALLRELARLCQSHDVPLFANDRPDLALLAGCDGVHVGQDDLPLEQVRRLAPGLLVGVSTHDEAQLRAALELRPDYVAFGPVFPTRSKAQPDPVVGVQGLARAGELARAAGVPLVAIGGIDQQRAALVAPHAQVGAVIGALLDEPAVSASALHRALGGTAPEAR